VFYLDDNSAESLQELSRRGLLDIGSAANPHRASDLVSWGSSKGRRPSEKSESDGKERCVDQAIKKITTFIHKTSNA